jgi:hypothetical protein
MQNFKTKKGETIMKLSSLMHEMQEILDETMTDVEKFELNFNKRAGTRIRKTMQTVKNLAQEIRLAVQEIKESRKEA